MCVGARVCVCACVRVCVRMCLTRATQTSTYARKHTQDTTKLNGLNERMPARRPPEQLHKPQFQPLCWQRPVLFVNNPQLELLRYYFCSPLRCSTVVSDGLLSQTFCNELWVKVTLCVLVLTQVCVLIVCVLAVESSCVVGVLTVSGDVLLSRCNELWEIAVPVCGVGGSVGSDAL